MTAPEDSNRRPGTVLDWFSTPRSTEIGDEPVFLPHHGKGSHFWASAAILFLLAIAIRLVNIDHNVVTDEINHVLAARSLLSDGTLKLDAISAPYTRGWAFTLITAGMFSVFGESLLVARVLPLLFGGLLVVVLFAWVRCIGGALAGWAAALLLALAPISIYVSQYVRFYTLHALLILVAGVAVYRLTVSPLPAQRKTFGLVTLAVVAGAMAFHLQPTTLIALLGFLLWGLVSRVPNTVGYLIRKPFGTVALTGMVLVGITAMFLLFQSRVGTYVLERLDQTAIWAEGTRDYFLFYHALFIDQYPTLWTLFPLAALLAAVRNRWAASFATLVFSVAFLVHSIAAFKSERFLFYALPFFFAVWGLAIAVAAPRLMQTLEEVVESAGLFRRGSPWTRCLALFLMAGSILFAAHGNRASTYLRHMLTREDADWVLPARYRGEPDWARAAQVLKPLSERAELVAASSDIEPLYFLERLDLHLGFVAAESRNQDEFTLARKTRRPVVMLPSSLALLVGCSSSGLVVVEDKRWRSPAGIPDSLADFIERALVPVPLHEDLRMRAFRWEQDWETVREHCPDDAREFLFRTFPRLRTGGA